jgi:hypothetical protein
MENKSINLLDYKLVYGRSDGMPNLLNIWSYVGDAGISMILRWVGLVQDRDNKL